MDGTWSGPTALDATQFYVRPDYLQTPFLSGQNDPVVLRAVGLLSEEGYGPIAMVPRFKDRLTITFLADGAGAQAASDRVSNPSAVRVPVAIALPQSPELADLLSALASASFVGAEEIWDDQAKPLGTDDSAFELLLNKSNDPAAALLAVHFLARFAPRRVPVRWLDNLRQLLSEVADTHLLLAIRVFADGGRVSGHDAKELLLSAAAAPACLFSRTRALLTQAMRLHKMLVVKESDDARAMPGDFLNVSADAAGLEAFWVRPPSIPETNRYSDFHCLRARRA